MQFRQIRIFQKQMKRLVKKYRSLPSDIEKLQQVLLVYPEGNGSKHWNRLQVSDDGFIAIFKVRLSCASLKGKADFRIVYAWNKKDDSLVLLDFIEVYFKGEQGNEDRTLIEEYLDDCESMF